MSPTTVALSGGCEHDLVGIAEFAVEAFDEGQRRQCRASFHIGLQVVDAMRERSDDLSSGLDIEALVGQRSRCLTTCELGEGQLGDPSIPTPADAGSCRW